MKQFLDKYGIHLILLLGFALRVALVVQGQDLPVKWDEGAYVNRAWRILTDLAGYRDMMRAPFYPFFLAGVFGLIGELRFVIGIVQALLSTFTVAVIYTLTRLLFGRKDMALGAALFTALYLEFLTLTRVIMSETLFIVLSVFGITILFHAWKHSRPSTQFKNAGSGSDSSDFPADFSKSHYRLAIFELRWWEYIGAGVALALAALTRELLSYFAVLVLPVWVILVYLKQPRQMILNVAALAVGLILVFTPWVVRNYGIEQRFVLSTIHSEIDLLRDNWRIELRAQGLPLRTEEGSIKRRVRRALAQIPRSQRSVYALTNAAETIVHYPAEWLQDKTIRLRNFWRPFILEARVVRLENIEEPWRGLLQDIVSYSAVALLLLGTFGMLTARDDAPKLLIALYILYSLAIFLITHYLPRFRLPLLILLIPYAAFAVWQLGAWLRKPSADPIRQHPIRAAATALVLGLFVILIL